MAQVMCHLEVHYPIKYLLFLVVLKSITVLQVKGAKIGQRKVISSKDIKKINTMYNCSKTNGDEYGMSDIVNLLH